MRTVPAITAEFPCAPPAFGAAAGEGPAHARCPAEPTHSDCTAVEDALMHGSVAAVSAAQYDTCAAPSSKKVVREAGADLAAAAAAARSSASVHNG